MRKLASIQTIADIQPIPKYDRVELATILGWECIVKKGDFKIGDKCVYFEPDSQLYPHSIWNSFLESRKFKIKTIKMCGVYSQGLVLPVSVINELNPTLKWSEEDGFDLTDGLNVTHFQKGKLSDENKNQTKSPKHPVIKFMMKFKWFRKLYNLWFGKNRGDFPTYLISKSDETNIQSKPSVLDNNRGERFYVTEKLEGQSGTFLIKPLNGVFNKLSDKHEFVVCSRNMRKNRADSSSWWTIAKKYNIRSIIEKYYKKHGIRIAIQGEVIGTAIQGNIYKLNEYDFYIFNIKDIDNNRYFNITEKLAFCEDTGLKHVPVLDLNFIITDDVCPKGLLKMSNGTSVLYNTPREGIVFRKFDDDRISFKARSPEYTSNENAVVEDE